MYRLILLAMLLACPIVQAGENEAFQALTPLSTAELVLVGKMTKVVNGPVGLSNPPLYTFKIEIEASEALRGEKPGKSTYGYSIRTMNAPVFDQNLTYLVGVNKGTLTAIIPAEKEDIARAKKLMALPAGWVISDGKPISPWSGFGENAWPKDGPKLAETVCAKSGRPALLCGQGIEWKVEQIPAKNPKKFMNDMFGDGSFKVSVTNTTKVDATINALLTDGKGTILWGDSVFLSLRGKNYPFPTMGRVTKETQPLKLKAGETVSGELNTLPVAGIPWPNGGSRIYFDFVLGEKSVNQFFYYHINVHNAMRDEAIKQLTPAKQ